MEKYKISFIEIGCRTYDKEKNLWTSDDCQVGFFEFISLEPHSNILLIEA